MFKFKKLKPTDLDKIAAAKRNRRSIFEAADLSGGQADMTMPHESYMIGLSSLKTASEPKAQSTGTRVIEASGDKFKGIYELISTSGPDTELQMINDKHYIEEYESAFENILDTPLEERGLEVRNVKIPALHVDALWLHDEKHPESDLYVPVKSMNLFIDNKVYDKKTFFEILQNAAKDYDTSDQLIGG